MTEKFNYCVTQQWQEDAKQFPVIWSCCLATSWPRAAHAGRSAASSCTQDVWHARNFSSPKQLSRFWYLYTRSTEFNSGSYLLSLLNGVSRTAHVTVWEWVVEAIEAYFKALSQDCRISRLTGLRVVNRTRGLLNKWQHYSLFRMCTAQTNTGQRERDIMLASQWKRAGEAPQSAVHAMFLQQNNNQARFCTHLHPEYTYRSTTTTVSHENQTECYQSSN
jgi:hypothetical protein